MSHRIRSCRGKTISRCETTKRCWNVKIVENLIELLQKFLVKNNKVMIYFEFQNSVIEFQITVSKNP